MGDNFKFILEYNEYLENIFNSDKDLYIYGEIKKRTKFGRLSLVEGLIYTCPVDKSINILRRRFPELDIEKEIDDEIFIQNLDNKLNKYLPLITNLGYFISKMTVDGNDWEIEYNDNSKPIAIYLEPKYDYEVSIPDILFHSSPLKLKDKILKYGLSPRSGNKLSKHPERIYLTDDINKAISFGNYLKSEENNEWYKNGYCVYSINGKCLTKLYSDINFREGGYYTMNNIGPNDIKLIKEFEF